jgi:hypothetical protein
LTHHGFLDEWQIANGLDALASRLSEAIQTDQSPAVTFSHKSRFFLRFQTTKPDHETGHESLTTTPPVISRAMELLSSVKGEGEPSPLF